VVRDDLLKTHIVLNGYVFLYFAVAEVWQTENNVNKIKILEHVYRLITGVMIMSSICWFYKRMPRCLLQASNEKN
jgi:hypothetical protein